MIIPIVYPNMIDQLDGIHVNVCLKPKNVGGIQLEFFFLIKVIAVIFIPFGVRTG